MTMDRAVDLNCYQVTNPLDVAFYLIDLDVLAAQVGVHIFGQSKAGV